MALKSIPINDPGLLDLYIQVKVRFVNNNPKRKITDQNILTEVFKIYLEN